MVGITRSKVIVSNDFLDGKYIVDDPVYFCELEPFKYSYF